jgi:hypothetical protein
MLLKDAGPYDEVRISAFIFQRNERPPSSLQDICTPQKKPTQLPKP